MKYRAEIDGLRALAVLPVILFHAGSGVFKGGFIGVDVFFVISGYLITTILINEMQEKRFSIIKFYERRARRILPALFLVMLFCIPFVWFFLSPKETVGFAKSLIATVSFSSNILFWQESGYFDIEAELKPLLHTWSLAVEEQYYIIFPLFLLIAWRFGQAFILITLAGIFLLSLGVSHWASYNKPAAAFFLLPTRGWQILLGSFCAFYLNKQKVYLNAKTNQVLSILGLLLIVCSMLVFDKSTPTPSLITLIPSLGVVLIILCAREGTYAKKLLSTKAMVGVGLISYSAYLWHQPVFVFARFSEIELSGFTIYILGLVSLALAWISWRFVEAPFRNPSTISSKAIFQFSLIGIVLFTAIGTFTIFNSGNLYRYPDHVIQLNSMRKNWDEHVWKEKNKLNGREFQQEDSVKILVVGDSNSGDLINAIKAMPTKKSIEVSSLTIRAGCGNLYLPREKFVSMRERTQESCVTDDDLFSNASEKLFREASFVVFASLWKGWELDFIDASYEKLIQLYGDKVWLLGSKKSNFEYDEFYKIYGDNPHPSNINAMPKDDTLYINTRIEKIAESRFLNVVDLICKEGGCPIIDKNGNHIFYDGFHLTPFGAEKLGNQLFERNIFGLRE